MRPVASQPRSRAKSTSSGSEGDWDIDVDADVDVDAVGEGGIDAVGHRGERVAVRQRATAAMHVGRAVDGHLDRFDLAGQVRRRGREADAVGHDSGREAGAVGQLEQLHDAVAQRRDVLQRLAAENREVDRLMGRTAQHVREGLEHPLSRLLGHDRRIHVVEALPAIRALEVAVVAGNDGDGLPDDLAMETQHLVVEQPGLHALLVEGVEQIAAPVEIVDHGGVERHRRWRAAGPDLQQLLRSCTLERLQSVDDALIQDVDRSSEGIEEGKPGRPLLGKRDHDVVRALHGHRSPP